MPRYLEITVVRSAVATAGLLALAVSTPAHANHQCKAGSVVGTAQHGVSATANQKARQAWQVKVIQQYSMHWAGWQYAKNRQVSCEVVSRQPNGAMQVRCVAIARPCRAH